MAVTGTMGVGEGKEHLDVIHISLQISRQNVKNNLVWVSLRLINREAP
jgi:hypothetical protein